MRYLFYFLLFAFIFQSQLNAQENNDILLDSMFNENDRAFELFQKGRYGESIKVNTKVLEYAIESKNDILQGRAYNALGNAHYYVNKDSLSFYYLFKARDAFVKAKDTFNIVLAYNDIGVNYRDFDSVSKAKLYFTKAINLARHGGYLTDMVYPLANIADDAINIEEDYVNGIKYSLEALEIISKIPSYEDRRVKSEIYQQLAYAYYKIGDKNNHQLYYNKCLDFAKKNKYFEVIAVLYTKQSKLYALDKKFEDAYKLSNELSVIKDSIEAVKEYKKAKQVEADNFLKENAEKLNFVQKEKQLQDEAIKKANIYNIVLALFSFILLFSIYSIFKKNKQLNEARDKAEELSRVKSDFYSEISHELRTPLYAVIELSNLLLKENVNSTHKEYLESLNFSGNHLLALINNVLELNKVESGKLKLENLDFRLKSLISNIIESLEYAIRGSQNKIHLNYDKNIPSQLSGDSLKLSQIFINLISNAIKFTKNGNIYITMKLVEEYKEEVKIFFEVKDDGIGIPKEKQIKVFESFYQEHTKSENSYKGTGLGLSIVKRTLNIMGGDIAIESEINQGTAFSFELMFSKNSYTLETELEYDKIVKGLTGKCFLVVDDNKINQLVTKKILNQFNIKSKVIDSGEKAIEILKNENFDCILMDLHMPKLDGYETTRLIKEFNKDIPIVALTAASTEEVEAKIINSNMNGYVLKPFKTIDFLETIYKALN